MAGLVRNAATCVSLMLLMSACVNVPDGSPMVGHQAPSFSLPAMDGGPPLEFPGTADRRPSVIVFGSWSCASFRFQAFALEEFYTTHRDRARFAFVYGEEAHEFRMAFARILRPGAHPEGREAGRCSDAAYMKEVLGLGIPVYLDDLDERVKNAWGAVNYSVFVIDADGVVRYRSDGPWIYKIPGARAALDAILEPAAADVAGTAE